MIKLPRTLHIEGSRLKAGQVDPEAVEFAKLAGQFLVVEEKLDGTGVSLFFEGNELQIYHRGTKIGRKDKEFTFLYDWGVRHLEELYVLLEDRYVLFGEWMLHKHSIFYDRLPHYFLESDIYDTKMAIWLSTETRHALLTGHNYIHSVPVLASLTPTKLSQLTGLITKPVYQTENWRSHLWDRCEKLVMDLAPVLKETDQSDLSEGLYIKHEQERQVLGRYKYVRYEFLETIINSGSHVMNREPIWNGASGGLKCLYWPA
jgi:RNA ligase-like protein